MDVRTYMINYRNDQQISLKTMANKLDISETLLAIVENGGVTVPGIAKRIGKLYKLTELQTEELMPECMRTHGPNYDPPGPLSKVPVVPKRINKYTCYECNERTDGCHETCTRYLDMAQYNEKLREAEYRAKRQW